jgi:prepilin-type N-terminal cleavage/methylation domain-containing protein
MNNKKGFTLIELIIAIALMAMVSAFVAGFMTPMYKTYISQQTFNYVNNQCNTAVTSIVEQIKYADSLAIGKDSDANLDQSIKQSTNVIDYDGHTKFDENFFEKSNITLEFEKVADRTLLVTVKATGENVSTQVCSSVQLNGLGSDAIATNGSVTSNKLAFHVTPRKDLITNPE